MKRALIVEGDPTVKRALLRRLGRHGWWVDAVESIERALEFLDRPPPDAVLIAWEADQGSGPALLRAIRLHETWRTVPIVMTNDLTTAASHEDARALAANDFLSRPFTAEAARLRLDRWTFTAL